MSEELLIRHCSPTLAGIKTGNLFSCFFSDESELKKCVRGWNQQLAPKGLRILPMKIEKGRALIYVYRPSRLSEDLKQDTAEMMLNKLGYEAENSQRCVCELMKRLRSSDCFPHEIGLFLGYPPEDVRGFIENKAEGCKCVGCWKVYGNEAEAKKKFAQYKKCKKIYCKLFAGGKSLDRLTVAA